MSEYRVKLGLVANGRISHDEIIVTAGSEQDAMAEARRQKDQTCYEGEVGRWKAVSVESLENFDFS